MAMLSTRDTRLRRERAKQRTLTDLARRFQISRTRVVQILERTGGDPLGAQFQDLAVVTMGQLEAEEGRLLDRIASDRRRLRAVRDERDSRLTDRILGLTV